MRTRFAVSGTFTHFCNVECVLLHVFPWRMCGCDLAIVGCSLWCVDYIRYNMWLYRACSVHRPTRYNLLAIGMNNCFIANFDG